MKHTLRLVVAAVSVVLFAAIVHSHPHEGEVTNAPPVPAFTVHSFSATKDKLTFLVFGDWGTGDVNQKRIARLMNEKAAADGAQLAVAVGDNFYPVGVSSVTDPQWKRKWTDIYTGSALQIPFYVCLGNHDYVDVPGAEIEYSAHDPRWKMPAHFFAFSEPISTQSRVDFFALDTTPIAQNRKDSIAEQVEWLEKELKASTARWKIVFGHHPVYSNGAHGNTRTMQEFFKPLFEKYHVDLYLCGHDHDVEVLKPVNGVHYIVSGGGAGWRSITCGPNTLYAQTNLGFVWCAATDTLLEAQCIDRDGKVQYVEDIRK